VLISSETLAAAIGGTVNESGDSVVSVSAPLFGDSFGTHLLSMRADENQLRFSIPLDGAAEETHLVAHDHLMQIPDVLIHFQADFRESMNERPNNSVDQLIARLEKMYQHWRVQSRSPSELRSEFGTTSPTIPLTSVAEGDRSAGDYK
jgi:hypothetical protein